MFLAFKRSENMGGVIKNLDTSCYLRLHTQEMALVPDSGWDERISSAQEKCLVWADLFSATAKRISLT